MNRGYLILSLVAVGAVSFATYRAVTKAKPVVHPGPNLLMNGWGITPVGNHVRIGDMALKMVFSPDRKQLVTTTLGFGGVHVTTLDAATHQVIQTVDLEKVWNGIAFSPDGKTLYISGGNSGKLLAFDYDAGKLTKRNEIKGPEYAFISGLAVSPKTGRIYACNESFNQLYALEPGTLKVLGIVNTGSNPHSCCLGEDGRHLYISNWGSNSVTVVDTQTNAHVRDIRVGIRPNDMALAPDGRLFVACAGDNTVHVIQTRSLEAAVGGPTRATRPPEGVREVLNTAIEPTLLEGSSPVAVSVAPDGKTLYVANADNNDVLVADISDPKTTTIQGFIPTGWYPTAVAAGESQLYVAVGKGLHSRANYPSKVANPEEGRQGQKFDYTGNCFEGYVSAIPIGSAPALTAWTRQVRANIPFRVDNVLRTAAKSDSIVPDATNKPSPIDHVLYVIMENRTYDQVFGDMKEGNGEPYLCMYGEKVTPNRHKLAREYTLLDNLYCNGEVSYDGHSWCDGAIATDEMQKQWTSGYSDHGDIVNGEELQVPAAGYLWDLARRHGLSVKAYGEGDSDYLGGHAVPVDSRGTWSEGRDMNRVDGWIKDLHKAETTGKLPSFMIMSLGEDHTSGTRPGSFTPEACVASNDVAIGKIIAAASRSKFWKSTAIFFVEDDAQDGPDHVDAHRTFGLVVSPWVKRHAVDHTMYSQVSMVRTIELLLGLPPMTQYDAAATPMFGVFGRKADTTPYQPAPAQVDLQAKNSPKAPGAKESMAMNLTEYDKAPADALNQILWAAAKGPNVPYPALHRTFGK
ncbi:bifunctional YncE family protein/alkaline phosphatase family protein [Fimbriimonas ginsengisoli]|uniref:Phosphoesterase n=1 Tax=Fimbriimonas ginsengisoli Gsoil 348 TaxID=661478 RepID=A0A068NLL6_FIMGI|nr:bifunctional YncE family protein/alkaline phosphatase family protein [Fimbriimonas ginsengisoli]AIE84453.1 phosphoesterase [Fimbriimonas ginsengisoli Gsoil 348]